MKKNKLFYIIPIALSLLLIIIGVFILLNNNKNNSNSENNNEIPDIPNDILSNISYKDYKTVDDNIVVIVRNNNSIDVSLSVVIEYMNDEKKVDTNSYLLNALPANKEAVVSFPITDKKYSDYNIKIEGNKLTDYISYYDDVKIEPSKIDEIKMIEVKINNNSNDTISEIDLGVLYYKNGNVITYENMKLTEALGNASYGSRFKFPHEKNNQYSYIDFDVFKVILNGAYSVKNINN